MTARELIIAAISSRPLTLTHITGLLVGHGYPESSARGMAESWLMILRDRKQVSVTIVDGESVYRLETAEYEAPEVIEKKSANQTWRDALAKHGARK